MQSKAKNLVLKNTVILFFGQMITWALSIISAIYVPSYIGPTGTGEIALAGALTSLVGTLSGLGMGALMVRDMARDHDQAPDLIGAAMVIKLLMSLPILLIMDAIGWVAGYPVHTQVVISIASVSMIFGLLSGPFEAGFQAFERMKYNSFSTIIAEAVITIGSVAIIIIGRGVILLTCAGAFASLVVLMLNVIWWRSLGTIRLHFNFRLLRYLIVGGLPFWATGIFLTIYLYIDSLMLSFLTNTEVVGWYSVPTKLFGLLLFIPTIVSTALFPALARAYKHAPREMVKIARRSFNLLTCLSLPVAVGGMLLARQIITMLYGVRFGPSIPVMMVLAATTVPTYLNILVNQFLVAAERQIIWTKVMAAACIVNPLINLGLIQFYQQKHGNGAFGAAWALLLTEGIMMIAGIAILPRGVLGWSNLVSMIKSCAAAGLMALSIFFTRDYFIAIPIIIGAGVYVVAALALGALPLQDFEILAPLGAKVMKKLGIKRALPKAMKAV